MVICAAPQPWQPPDMRIETTPSSTSTSSTKPPCIASAGLIRSSMTPWILSIISLLPIHCSFPAGGRHLSIPGATSCTKPLPKTACKIDKSEEAGNGSYGEERTTTTGQRDEAKETVMHIACG